MAGKPDTPDRLWIKALIAIAAFLVGIFCFTYGSWLLGPLRRITIIFSFFIQTIALLIAAVLVQTHMIDETPTQDPTQWIEDVAIALLAFQAAGQILASKFLGFPEIPTVALTALMCDLFLDKNLFQQPLSSNPKRNRKLGFIVALTFGSMTAGGVAKDYGLASGFWLAMALKGAITLSWFFWPETPPSEEKEIT